MRALLLGCTLGVLALAGHASAAQAASAEATCAQVGTDDALRPLMPSLVGPAIQAFGYTGMTATEVEHMTVFRCMDGAVLMCSWGANLDCGKAETSSSLPAASNWCEGNRNAGFIPAYVTGHDTIYQWSCHDGNAVTTKAAPLDRRGFFKSYWAPAQ
jgi:hypothetical protein